MYVCVYRKKCRRMKNEKIKLNFTQPYYVELLLDVVQ